MGLMLGNMGILVFLCTTGATGRSDIILESAVGALIHEGHDSPGFAHMWIVVFQKRYGLLTYGIRLARLFQ
jgi:hypothetical protein